MKISVCIATFRRLERLDLVLGDLAAQERLPDEVIVVDNDAQGSARVVVERFLEKHGAFPVKYDIQPERNIARTRNFTVARAQGGWLAFIDDDERAPKAWLRQLIEFALAQKADGVLGPVIPLVPPTAPDWIQRGNFYDFPRLPSGAVVPLNRMRFGNLILRGEPLRALEGPFDERYGLMAGEDGDLLVRMVGEGARIVWCDEAIVEEPVEASRLSLRWLMQRALGGGQEFARKSLAGRYGPVTPWIRVRFFLVALAQLCLAAVLALATLPFGTHRAAHWLTRSWANFGKISVLWGSQHREYAALK
jgi:succinoglycan biosynthesis protein ExoM